MLKNDNLATKIWDVVYPLAMYYAVTIIAMFAAKLILGNGNERYVLCQIIANAVTLPVLYYSFYKRDKMVWPFGALDAFFKGGQAERPDNAGEGCTGRRRGINAVFIVLSAAMLGAGLNNLILMSPIVSVSAGYAEASSHFYGSTLILELIGSALLAPLLEELVYRGIIFARLKRMIGFLPAMAVSSLVFALMHFNLVQFIYALLFGMVLAVYMEKTGHMYGAVIGHITANAISVLRTETGFLSGTLDGSLSAWLISAGICILGAGLLLVYLKLGSRRKA